ncbi:membrane protein containing DUF1295 [Trypanosoma grayi]|uniref:membrane protein containing DUF1295 n=1 Tax=Trypanosoma grayi TaxID=71804 RepID=UPI0004F4075B|nr:membrane protein containing DUF1295 [Trypanosoma grayi]KEG13470.1 membrane protein containing DUF1295 [Trypanosoma grayi]
MYLVSTELSLQTLLASSYNFTLALMVTMALVMYAASVIHRNYSWVDRSWSIAPVVYTWIHIYYNVKGTLPSQSLCTLNNAAVFYGIIVTVWGIRLTFNFARRGGYSRGNEDYRWSYIRSWPGLANPIVWELYSFWSIAVFQTAVLWAITLPVISIPSVPISIKDVVIGSCMLLFVIFETICDEQQQRFQRAKRAFQERRRGRGQTEGEETLLSYGFRVTGVFGYSRHLNVFCEGSIWVTLAVGALAHAHLAWWQWIGCITVELLTYYSTAFITEELSRQKYPLYAIYQKTTPMLFPSVKSTTQHTLYLLSKESQKTK